ncbi:hypothetical protein Agub_g6434 [Astrephomene gubernaculifera]|uniref:HPP transmembrane region domain-containing protein n=1 Tax=Astrephomene gubernaculifera TaxID=47775 RepID=A0AAD3DSF2_9CHLO|nr:hypothetical protein Agub_g6434 [Astrephomene gubernaculifera]
MSSVTRSESLPILATSSANVASASPRNQPTGATAEAHPHPHLGSGANTTQLNGETARLLNDYPPRAPAPSSPAERLRRAFTAPWHALAVRRTTQARASSFDLSAHVLCGTRPILAPAVDPSIRSQASHRSSTSRFTVDGLPEVPAPDASAHSLSHHLGDGSNRTPMGLPSLALVGSIGTSRLGRAAKAPACLNRPESQGSQDTSSNGKATASDRPWQHVHPQQEQQQQPGLQSGGLTEAAALTSRASGGAVAACGHPATLAAPPLPLEAGGEREPVAAVKHTPSPPSAAPSPAAAVLPAAASMVGLDWDDVRNPMSPYYNPLLDQQPRSRPDDAAASQAPQGSSSAVLPPPPPPVSCKSQDCSQSGRHRRHFPAASPPLPSAFAPAPAGLEPCGGGDANANGSKGCSARDAFGTVSGGGSGRGGDHADNARVVLLEMKGPRGTPTRAQAAATAFASGASASPAGPEAAAAALALKLTLRGRVASYFGKWRGVGDTLMPADQPVDIFWSWLGAFLSILLVALLHQYLTPRISLPLMIASFGASAVLLFGVPASKLAQPRNLLGRTFWVKKGAGNQLPCT